MAKTAIITGSSSGVGRESAVALSKAGWNVVLTARRADALHETSLLCTSPETCLVLAGDVTDEDFVKKLFSETVARFGRLDLLFNVSSSAG
ncbi:short-chain dehydrogenase/reductase SDR [Mycena olivaceomarginata]|nr:short-chain dehydrogenase/reductase SDR [Mycena olivaceomarginata]